MSKRKLLKSSVALLLSSLIVTSGATVFTASAAETDTSKSNDTAQQSETEDSGKDPDLSKPTATMLDEDGMLIEYNGQTFGTGDLGVSEEGAKSIEEINSLAEYKALLEENGNKSQFISDDSTAGNLPATVDNSQTEYFPEINSQGSVGSCVAWATLYYQMTYTVNRDLKRKATWNTTFSPLWIYNCCNNGNTMRGMFSDEPYYYVNKVGAATLRTSPNLYDHLEWTGTETAGVEAQKYRVKSRETLAVGKETITSPQSPSLTLIKTALAEGEILTVSTSAYGWQEHVIETNAQVPENQKYAGEIIYPYLVNATGGHRVTVVGYNDNIWYDINNDGKVQEAEKGAFKVANSWGTNFCNNGFVWVSYDALNKVSAVDNDFLKKCRYNGSLLNGFMRMTAESVEPASGVNLEFSAVSDSRAEIGVTVTAVDEKGQKTTASVVEPFYSQQVSNEKVFPLSTKKTFVYDLAKFKAGVTADDFKNYQWTVTFKDSTKNNKKSTISDIKIVNTNLDVEYKSSVGTKTLDGTSFDTTIDTSASNEVSLLGYSADTPDSENQTVIYYKGYSTPYIHYQVGSGSWTNAPGYAMTATSEKSGYTHKYTIDLGSQSYANVCFNDGNGNWDSKNGANYRFEKGTYTYSNGTMTKISTPTPSPDPFRVSYFHSNDNEKVIYTNEPLELSADAKGTGLTFSYRFGYIKNGSEVLGSYSSANKASFNITSAASVVPVVYVKDNKGNVVKKTGKTITVKAPFGISNFNSNGSSVKLGANYSASFTLSNSLNSAKGKEVYIHTTRNGEPYTNSYCNFTGSFSDVVTTVAQPGNYQVAYEVFDSDGRRAFVTDEFYVAPTSASACEVYYHSDSAATMYYSTDSGKTFKSVKMSANTKYASTNYYAKISSLSGTAKVYFVDANNVKDDNNGQYYTLSSGKYLFNYGNFYCVTDSVPEMKVTYKSVYLSEDDCDASGKLKLGKKVNLYLDLNSDSYGACKVEYGYICEDGKKIRDSECIRKLGTFFSVSPRILHSGSIKPYVTITNIYGKSVTAVYDPIEVVGTKFKEITISPSSTVQTGTSLKISSLFDYVTDGCYIYYTITKNGESCMTRTPSAKFPEFTWTPSQSGIYTVEAVAKTNGIIEDVCTKNLTVTSGALSIDSFTTTSPAQITYPARVYTTVSVSGGTEPYTYQFGYIQNGKTTYYNSQTYGGCEYVFTEVGTKFTPIVKVTDAKGDTAQKQLNEFTIVDGIKIESLTTTPASPIKVGTEITFNPVIKNAVSKYGRYSSALITINKDNTKVAEVDYNNGEKTWTPTEAGTYTATFDLSDFYGAKASKTITFTVQKDDPVTENEVTIYYKGYSSPYIHYQVDGGSWTNAPGYAMTATTEQSGYTHKYTIKLGQKTFATVCFNDGGNSWDSNNGSNYKFNKGTYGYSGGKIVEISKPTPAELTAKASITGGNNVPTNQSFTIVGSATGGTAPYQYKYTYSLGSTETVIKDFSTLTSTSFKFTTPGTYTVKVTVKDSTGKTATATTSVSAAMIDITGIKADKTTIKAGETVTFTASANNSRVPVTYKYAISGNNVSQTLTTNSNGSATWTPSKEGTYTLSVSMLYNGSAITTKTMSYTVEKADPVTENTVTIYYKGYSTPYIHYQVDGGSWTNAPGYAMTATSEVSGYTHKYTIKLGQKTFATVCFNNGGNSWDSNNGSNYKFNKGTYTFSNGTITPYNPVPQELSAKVEITGGSYVPANVSCTINATATGGTAPYQYQFTASVNGTEKTIKSYSTSSSVSYKPETGISSVKVTIKDSTGKTAQATTNLYIVNVGFGAFRASKDKAKTGENVTFTAMADNCRLSFTYKFTITGNGTTQTLNSTTGTATWTPSKEGTYTVKADILYYGSVAATKSMSYTVEKGDDVNLNQVVIYYKGYSTPYIHYQVGSGDWTTPPGKAMTATSEMSGYTHKYTIDLGTQSYANVCFNDGKGNWDSRNGANYRFTKGKYTFSNGVITAVQNKAILVVDPLTAKPSISAKTITLGDTITAKCDAEGGTGSYKYAFYYRKSSSSKWVTTQNFGNNNTVSIKPAVATSYEVCIKVKDGNGTLQKKYFTVNVQKKFENVSSISTDSIKLGETITATAAATGGSEVYTYGVYYKKHTSTKWTTAQSYGDNNVVNVKPAAAATYDVCVKVKDSDGTITKQYFTVKVTK